MYELVHYIKSINFYAKVNHSANILNHFFEPLKIGS